MVDLLSCPFCGGHAQVTSFHGQPYNGRVTCKDCDCHAEVSHFYTDAEAIAAWNRRARPSPTGEKVEAVARFEITYDPDVGMIHRPHPHGYYVRWSDCAALEAERDEAQLRIAYLEEEIVRVRDLAVEHSTHSATANARVAELEKVLEDLLSWFPDEPSKPEWRLEAGKYGADEAVTAARAALTGGEDG